MIFKYKGYDKDGNKVASKINTSSKEEAFALLSERGILVEKLSEQRSFFIREIDPSTLATIARNLSIYLKSGITLYRALNLLEENFAKDKKIKLFLNSLASEIKEGKNFYEALKNQNIYKIPQFFTYTIEAAEKSSNLQNSLRDLSDFIFASVRLKREVAKAFIYPSFIVIIAVAMVNFMLTSIVPKIVEIFERTDANLPTATKITLAVSNFLKEYGLIFLVIAAVFFLVIGWMRYKNDKFRKGFDKGLLRLPVLSKIILNYELGMFCKVGALLLSSGVPFAQAIHFASKTFSNAALREAFLKIANMIVEGRSFSAAVAIQKDIKVPNDFLNAVAVGENSSELPYTLDSLSEFYESDNKDRIEIMLSLLEPVLMLVVGGVIGFLVISMLLPIFSISVG